MRRLLFAFALLVHGAAAMAQAAPVFDPTQFQSGAATESAPESAGIKAGVGIESFDYRRRGTSAPGLALRSALELRKEWRTGDGITLTLSDRLEWLQDDSGHGTLRNALREGFASAGFGDELFVDAGRINLRSGVGLGFNPSDWLREGAALPQTTQNPAVQRENRLGTVMLKAQAVQGWGAAHVALIPHLAPRPDQVSPYGLDFGRTNEDPALHFRVAPQVSERISVDALAYARRGRHPQWAVNTTAVLNEALIWHLEWSTGKRMGLTAPAQVASAARHDRLATGLSWTAANGTVIAVERHLASDALSRKDWDAWRLSSDATTARRLAQLRGERLSLQEPLVRDAWFLRAALNGMLKDPDIDLSGFVRINPHDRSRLWQIDGSWHATAHLSVHVGMGGFAGDARSEFGANPLRSFASLRLEVAY
ncbi:MAG: hypothetical protein Q8M11_23940 [Sulfuritalea sp.]|nr:hypothetical protein [Sulfuritalea sp.]MDP1983918.1 hypothetical protein [Sulfuritalea sp.]